MRLFLLSFSTNFSTSVWKRFLKSWSVLWGFRPRLRALSVNCCAKFHQLLCWCFGCWARIKVGEGGGGEEERRARVTRNQKPSSVKSRCSTAPSLTSSRLILLTSSISLTPALSALSSPGVLTRRRENRCPFSPPLGWSSPARKLLHNELIKRRPSRRQHARGPQTSPPFGLLRLERGRGPWAGFWIGLATLGDSLRVYNVNESVHLAEWKGKSI